MPTNDRDSLFDLPLMPPKRASDSKLDVKTQEFTQDLQRTFNRFDCQEAQKKLTTVSEQEWIERGQQRALRLFHAASEHVPAYQDFLKKHKINPSRIKSLDDFKSHVPVMDKENYLNHYPLKKLSWHGELTSNQYISVSSGSSGEPFFWPRGQILDTETSLQHELLLNSFFNIESQSTLFIVCFAMGMYVAGPLTTNSIKQLGTKGYPITVVTPGYAPEDVMKIFPKLSPKYDQVVIAGYPPYVKELLDMLRENDTDLKQIKLKFLLAGEGFNETWRTYVAELAGQKNPNQDFINLYGTADAAVLGHETETSIIIRRTLTDECKARNKLFNSEREPSLLQYHPEQKYFETLNDELIFTSTGGIPLIRYNVHDSGGVLSIRDIEEVAPHVSNALAGLRSKKRFWNLPFTYVFGKSDQTVPFYGANVYPENIRRALEDRTFAEIFTGKTIMFTDQDEFNDQRLHIEIECAKGVTVTRDLAADIKGHILRTLLDINSEFRSSYNGTGKKMIPIVHLREHNHENFSSGSIKHKWTRK